MPLADETVDWSALLQVVWVSVAAGLGVTVAASLAIFGTTRALDARREGQAMPAAMFSVIGLAGVLLLAAGVTLGVIVMTQKS